ncbi:nuclear factor Y [Perilla frutescens var. hirtella]|nr:nuclear factor Y [Perilla frutescens var. hirtella]
MVDNIHPHNSEKQRALKSYTNYAAVCVGGCDDDYDGGVLKEQERLLPIANVGRIMKQILPPNTKISKEGKETMQECVSEFISFVTGEASDKCHKEKRKTANSDDICWALGSLGFDDYSESLAEGERAANQDKAAAAVDEANNGGRDERVSPAPFSFNLMEKRRIV